MPDHAPAGRSRQRLDEAVVSRGLAESRSKARALILANDVLVNGIPVSKAGTLVRPDDALAVSAPPRFVSRGGEKLDHALDTFGLDVSGAIAADFGASTGGFTDCLLQRGVERVFAVDVGYGQLADRVRTDPRVIVMDRVNVRHLEALPEPVGLVAIDVSFIGLHLVLPAAERVLRPAGEIVTLVKPQFEAGRSEVARGGVVRDPQVHRRVLRGVVDTARDRGLGLLGLTASPLRGPAGNIEFLAHFKPGMDSIPVDEAIDHAMREAPL